jgi:hypothetical protein
MVAFCDSVLDVVDDFVGVADRAIARLVRFPESLNKWGYTSAVELKSPQWRRERERPAYQMATRAGSRRIGVSISNASNTRYWNARRTEKGRVVEAGKINLSTARRPEQIVRSKSYSRHGGDGKGTDTKPWARTHTREDTHRRKAEVVHTKSNRYAIWKPVEPSRSGNVTATTATTGTSLRYRAGNDESLKVAVSSKPLPSLPRPIPGRRNADIKGLNLANKKVLAGYTAPRATQQNRTWGDPASHLQRARPVSAPAQSETFEHHSRPLIPSIQKPAAKRYTSVGDVRAVPSASRFVRTPSRPMPVTWHGGDFDMDSLRPDLDRCDVLVIAVAEMEVCKEIFSGWKAQLDLYVVIFRLI